MKRSRILLAGFSALVPMAAAAPPLQAAVHPRSGFHPPDASLILTRTVWRSLRDGAQIMVRRRYEVRFVRQDDGYLLNGRLIDATVDAPEFLAPLAEMERTRPDNDLFPLALDHAGRIRDSGQAQPRPSTGAGEANRKAAGLVGTMVGRSDLSPADKRQARAMVDQIVAAGASSSSVPGELFDPLAVGRAERRRLELPGGGEGLIDIAIRVERASPDSLPQAVERTITTVMDGSTRTSRELWTFSSL